MLCMHMRCGRASSMRRTTATTLPSAILCQSLEHSIGCIPATGTASSQQSLLHDASCPASTQCCNLLAADTAPPAYTVCSCGRTTSASHRLLLQHPSHIGVAKAVQCLLQYSYVFCPVDQPLGPYAFRGLLCSAIREGHCAFYRDAPEARLAEAVSNESGVCAGCCSPYSLRVEWMLKGSQSTSRLQMCHSSWMPC